MPTTKPVPTGITKTEPAVSTASITGAVTAVIALLVAYGFDISEDQQVAILGVVAVLAPVIAGIVTRYQVFSPSSAQKAVNSAAATGDATLPPPPGK